MVEREASTDAATIACDRPARDDELPLFDYPENSICYINPARNKDLFQALLGKETLTAIAMEAVPRITRAQKMDTLSSMANVADDVSGSEAGGVSEQADRLNATRQQAVVAMRDTWTLRSEGRGDAGR